MTEMNHQDTNDTKRRLPNGWRWVRLGDLCEIRMGETLIAKDLTGDGLPVFSANTSSEPWGYTSRGRLKFDSDSVVVGARGSIGFPRWPKCPEWTATQTTIVITCRSRQRIFPAWLLRALECVDFGAITSKQAIPMITVEVLEQLGIPLPPLPEQQRIAAILNDQIAAVEHARAAAEVRQEAAIELPAAYLHAEFNSPQAQKWARCRLGELAILGPDNGAFKRRHEFGRGVPIVNVSDLFRSLVVNLNEVERVDTSEDELRRHGIAPGDLFFCRSSLKREGIGRCCYAREVSEPSIFDCHVMRVRLDAEKAYPEFVVHYWASPTVRDEVIGNSRTATMTTMNQNDLARVEIPLPPLPEQQRIAAILNEQMSVADRARKTIEEELVAINALPVALLRRAFSGEI